MLSLAPRPAPAIGLVITPTLKVKRKAVVELHGKLIEAVYDGGGLEV